MNPNLHPRRLAALLATAALLLAACGGGGDNTAETAEAPENTATAGALTADPAAEAEAVGTSPSDPGADDAEVAVATVDPPAPSDYLGSYRLMDDEFGTMVTVTVEGATRTIESNALPDHQTGDFPNAGNPNAISEQDLSFTFPVAGTWVGDAVFAQTPGVAVNGVTFEPGTAETVTCESGESARIEALQDTYNLGLDVNNAHVQPTGQYHYHGVSALLVDAYETGEDLVHVGFAADGYLVYYSKSGAYDSSYVLSTDTRTGTDCVASGPNQSTFDLEGSRPDGTYNTDWRYTEGAGDLDECNGTTIDGQYVYLLTDTYPYIGRCLNGEYSGQGGPGGGAPPGGGENAAPGGGGPGGGAPGANGPDLSAAAETLGVTVEELQAALGTPPPDLGAAAEILGVTVEELQAALPAPGG